MQHRFAGGDEYAEHTAAVMASPVEVEQVGMALTPLVDADGGDWDGFDQIGVNILAAVLDGADSFMLSRFRSCNSSRRASRRWFESPWPTESASGVPARPWGLASVCQNRVPSIRIVLGNGCGLVCLDAEGLACS